MDTHGQIQVLFHAPTGHMKIPEGCALGRLLRRNSCIHRGGRWGKTFGLDNNDAILMMYISNVHLWRLHNA